MKAFWAKLAEYAAQLTVYAAGHPDQAIALINIIKAAKS